ncbi:ATPase [Synergistales bacterium]|nr:ATPase [Synergistales bacterium]
MSIAEEITKGKTALGIELGSTRIKAVLIGADGSPIASGGYDWENRFENKIWTYHLDDVWTGLQTSFGQLSDEVMRKYGAALTTVGSLGVSAMMHGYLVFDQDGKQLAQFRTWRNTSTEKAAVSLTEKFNFNIPLRWSIAHLYQAILDEEPHVKDVAYMTTLAGYVHWKLTGKKALGVGDASGMFPIDSDANDYDGGMIAKFDTIVSEKNFSWKIKNILPKVLLAGEDAGTLTEEGAKLLDKGGKLQAGIPLCPPEGDAGTGMVATNSVARRTGNVSAGTSIFAMVVLEKPLSKVHTEIDMVTTPSGKPVAMAHCNNCTSDLDGWVRLFGEFSDGVGAKLSKSALYETLYNKALEGDADCGGLLSYNYVSGEPTTGFAEGRALFVRAQDSRFTLANFMRTHLLSTVASLKIGMDILTEQEHVKLDQLLGHGGLFKTKTVGQTLMAAALNVPVTVMESAGEGGAWGIALLAGYLTNKAENETLEDYLANKIFEGNAGHSVPPNKQDVRGFGEFMKRYKNGLAIEKAAVEHID